MLELISRPLFQNELKIPKRSSFLPHESSGRVKSSLSEKCGFVFGIVLKRAKSLETNEDLPKANISKPNR